MLERGVVVHLVYGQGSLSFVTPFFKHFIFSPLTRWLVSRVIEF